jgi:hypothetical protein
MVGRSVVILLLASTAAGCMQTTTTLERASDAAMKPRDRQLLANAPYADACVTVGEDALTWSGVAKVGRKEEWPSWVPTKEILQRIEGLPKFVEGGPKNPLGARGLYLFDGNKDTLFRIHGTNQPELIGEAISSGCIRMTNEDVIELYDKVKIGTPVVVLGPQNGDSPTNPRVAQVEMRS